MNNHNKPIIPEIEYGTPYKDMISVQKIFFDKVKNSLDKGNFIEIDNDSWYIDYYVETIACNWETIGLEALREKFHIINKLSYTKCNYIAVQNVSEKM